MVCLCVRWWVRGGAGAWGGRWAAGPLLQRRWAASLVSLHQLLVQTGSLCLHTNTCRLGATSPSHTHNPPHSLFAVPFFDEEDEALAAMEYARPRKISKSMSMNQLSMAAPEPHQETPPHGDAHAGSAGRPPRERWGLVGDMENGEGSCDVLGSVASPCLRAPA